ncbi:MAG: hypothetical protein ACO3XN_02655, partial [Chthoniobacterales bacterium]
MAGRLVTIGLVCFLLLGGALMLLGPWVKPDAAPDKLPACPYLQTGEFTTVPPELIAAIGAYEVIRETLGRGSIDGIAVQAGVIARTFSSSAPDIAKCAKRLADEPDLESARRAFMRLNRLMEKHARRMLAARFTRPGVL